MAAAKTSSPDPEDAGSGDQGPDTPGEGHAEGLSEEVRAMADSCFASASSAAVKNNFDYAIKLFIQGLRYNPRDLEHGHKGLRDCAMRRRNAGKGGGIGAMFGQFRSGISQMLGHNKDQFLALEESWARSPQDATLLTQLMQTARRLEYGDVAVWFGELAAEETFRSKKPQKQVFTTLADLYEARERYGDAVNALQQAIRIDPSDRMLGKRARDLAARASIKDSHIEDAKGAKDIILNKAEAAKSATQQVVRTHEQLEAQYAEYKAALDADPQNPVKMERVAECQAKRGFIDEAMALLQQAQTMTKQYRYKQKMDEIRMAESRRDIRELDEQLRREPARADLKAKRQQMVAEYAAMELTVYTERQKQYPTDMAIRYELGRCQIQSGQVDEAIVSFQTTTRDPKRRIDSLNQLGRCFFLKKLYMEAQSQFETAIGQYEIADNALGKELRYHLAKTFEAQNKVPQAIEWYSVIVQGDYQYRDAAKRLESLRKRVEGGEKAPGAAAG